MPRLIARKYCAEIAGGTHHTIIAALLSKLSFMF